MGFHPWPGTLQQQWQEGTAGKAQGETIASNTNTMGISKQGWGTFGVKRLGNREGPWASPHPSCEDTSVWDALCFSSGFQFWF